MNKPELLVPVGNNETFYAAIEGGANAIYFGLRHFNARERAVNFGNAQAPVLVEEARKKNVNTYITLNTVIKNNEINELLDTLSYLNSIKPSAIIVQDWAVYYLAKKYFPALNVHASTQMAIHNSIGVNYVYNKGIERVILARELTYGELQTIKAKTKAQLEIFVHGALCYSFSGMCFFSSYLGGYSANRGYCTQACRRLFTLHKENKFYFSLKDNQQIEQIPELIKLGIDSFKIEGRLKSDDYVYRVSKAYRMVIDNPEKREVITEAKKLLKFDMGRTKTSYFLGGNTKQAVGTRPNTGMFIGKIKSISQSGFSIVSNIELKKTYRLRIKNVKNGDQTNIKIKEFNVKNNTYFINTFKKFPARSSVYLSAAPEKSFPSKLPRLNHRHKSTINQSLKSKIYNEIYSVSEKKQNMLFVRINTLEWLRKIYFKGIDALILSFSKKNWEVFNPQTPFIQNNVQKIWIELPRFIPENNISYYKELIINMQKNGLNRFFISHISQRDIIEGNASISANENIYAYNDIAISFLKSENLEYYCYPQETDKENLLAGKFKDGIVPVYFYPQLFTSRMPVDMPSNKVFKDDTNKQFVKLVNEGITKVIPNQPVSYTQYVKTLKASGFKKFLIDLSHEKVSKNRFNTILNRFNKSEQIQPSTSYNFGRILK